MPTLTDLDPVLVQRNEYSLVRLKRMLGIDVKISECFKQAEYEQGEDAEFTDTAVKAVLSGVIKEGMLLKGKHIMFEMPPDSVGWATGRAGEFLDYCDTEVPNCFVIYRTSSHDHHTTQCIIVSQNERSRISAALLVKCRIEGTLPGIFTSRESETSHDTKQIRTRVFGIKRREQHIRNICREYSYLRELLPTEIIFEMMGPDTDKWFYIWGPNPQRELTEDLIRVAYFGDAGKSQKVLSDHHNDTLSFTCPDQFNIIQRCSVSYSFQTAKKKWRCVTFSYFENNSKKIAIINKSYRKRLAMSAVIKADIEETHPGYYNNESKDKLSTSQGDSCDTFVLCEGEKSVLSPFCNQIENATGSSVLIVGHVVHIIGDLIERKKARKYISLALATGKHNGVLTDVSDTGIDAVAVSDVDLDDKSLHAVRATNNVALFKTKIDDVRGILIAGASETVRSKVAEILRDKSKIEDCEKEYAKPAIGDRRESASFWRNPAKSTKRPNPYDDRDRKFRFNPQQRNYQGNRGSGGGGGGGYNQRGRDSHGPSGSGFTKYQKRY